MKWPGRRVVRPNRAAAGHSRTSRIKPDNARRRFKRSPARPQKTTDPSAGRGWIGGRGGASPAYGGAPTAISCVSAQGIGLPGLCDGNTACLREAYAEYVKMGRIGRGVDSKKKKEEKRRDVVENSTIIYIEKNMNVDALSR